MSRCKGCNAEILFATTDNGRKMPVDILPNNDGNVIITSRLECGELEYFAHVLSPATAKSYDGDRTRLHMPHFVTCPKAQRFRRR